MIFRKSGRERERCEGDTLVASSMGPGIDPATLDQELNPHPFGVGDDAVIAEPHRPGQEGLFK